MALYGWIGGAALAVLWVYRLIDNALGIPQITDISQGTVTPGPVPRLSVIVPARNEEKDIGACLASLLAVDYPGLEIIAVDDRSTDATGAIMDGLAADSSPDRLQVIHVRELPDGWMGKTHAMWSGSERASGEVLLFTDGDTFFRADSLRRAVNYLQDHKVDHLVLFPSMIFKSPGEKMMVSFFQSALGFAHRPWKVRDPKAYDHIGVGAFNLVRRSVYEAIGTYRAMRLEVIDDLRLGKLVKEHGFKQDVVLGPELVTIHWAAGALGIVRTLSKNAFALLRFNWLLVLGGSLGIALVTLGPVAGVLAAPGWSKAGYAVALAAMAGCYAQVRRITGISAAYFLLHPVGSVLSIYALLRSAWITWRHGVVWRGTAYPIAQFKREKS